MQQLELANAIESAAEHAQRGQKAQQASERKRRRAQQSTLASASTLDVSAHFDALAEACFDALAVFGRIRKLCKNLVAAVQHEARIMVREQTGVGALRAVRAQQLLADAVVALRVAIALSLTCGGEMPPARPKAAALYTLAVPLGASVLRRAALGDQSARPVEIVQAALANFVLQEEGERSHLLHVVDRDNVELEANGKGHSLRPVALRHVKVAIAAAQLLRALVVDVAPRVLGDSTDPLGSCKVGEQGTKKALNG